MEKVIVVFADAYNRSCGDEDYIAHSGAEAKRQCADLRKMGFEPVTKAFASEAEFYAWKAKKHG